MAIKIVRKSDGKVLRDTGQPKDPVLAAKAGTRATPEPKLLKAKGKVKGASKGSITVVTPLGGPEPVGYAPVVKVAPAASGEGSGGPKSPKSAKPVPKAPASVQQVVAMGQYQILPDFDLQYHDADHKCNRWLVHREKMMWYRVLQHGFDGSLSLESPSNFRFESREHETNSRHYRVVLGPHTETFLPTAVLSRVHEMERME
jgi:hypothetical protein